MTQKLLKPHMPLSARFPKTVVTCLLSWVLLTTVSRAQSNPVYLVLAEVISTEVYKEYANGTPPLLRAQMTVSEVLRGPETLKGETCFAFARDYQGDSNGGLFEVSIKAQDKCICGVVFSLAPIPVLNFSQSHPLQIGDDVIPVVNRHNQNFDAVLGRLRDRRDHPEKYPVPENVPKNAPNTEPTPSASVAEVPVISPPADKPPKAVQPGAKVNDSETTEAGSSWWWMGGAVAALVALVLGWLRRHTVKGGGT